MSATDETPTTYIAATLHAPDACLGCGAAWAYYDYDGGFKIAAVPTEHAAWLHQRLARSLDLFGARWSPTLGLAVQYAEEVAGPYDAQGRVE